MKFIKISAVGTTTNLSENKSKQIMQGLQYDHDSSTMNYVPFEYLTYISCKMVIRMCISRTHEIRSRILRKGR